MIAVCDDIYSTQTILNFNCKTRNIGIVYASVAFVPAARTGVGLLSADYPGKKQLGNIGTGNPDHKWMLKSLNRLSGRP